INPLSIATPAGPQVVKENGAVAIAGVALLNPAAPPTANVVATFSVEHGNLSLLTNVVGGLTAGQILGNGTGLVTVLAPVSAIGATLAAASGLTYIVDTGY